MDRIKFGQKREYKRLCFSELICLSNLENINALLINEGHSQKERLIKLNEIAIKQMQLLNGLKNNNLLNRNS